MNCWNVPYWRKRKNLPQRDAAVDAASLQQLAALIREYFHHTEGRGKNRVVEPFRRGELDYFFAYPEDYSQQSVEWVDGEFGRRPHNPAFEVIYVYSQQEGSLDLNFRGSYKAIEPLQSLFANCYFHMVLAGYMSPSSQVLRVLPLLCQYDNIPEIKVFYTYYYLASLYYSPHDFSEISDDPLRALPS